MTSHIHRLVALLLPVFVVSCSSASSPERSQVSPSPTLTAPPPVTSDTEFARALCNAVNFQSEVTVNLIQLSEAEGAPDSNGFPSSSEQVASFFGSASYRLGRAEGWIAAAESWPYEARKAEPDEALSLFYEWYEVPSGELDQYAASKLAQLVWAMQALMTAAVRDHQEVGALLSPGDAKNSSDKARLLHVLATSQVKLEFDLEGGPSVASSGTDFDYRPGTPLTCP